MKNRPHQIISERGNHVPVYPALQLQTPSTLFGVVSWGLRGNLEHCWISRSFRNGKSMGFPPRFPPRFPWVFLVFHSRFPWFFHLVFRETIRETTGFPASALRCAPQFTWVQSLRTWANVLRGRDDGMTAMVWRLWYDGYGYLWLSMVLYYELWF